MHNRQSGVAHVSIVFVLILLVLFLGALAFAYVSVSKNNELMTENASLKAEHVTDVGRIKIRDHYIEDIGKVFNMNGAYNGRTGVNKDEYKDQNLVGIPGVMDPVAVQAAFDKHTEAIGKLTTGAALAPARGLDNVFVSVTGAVDAVKKQNADLASDRDKVADEKSKIDKSYNDARNEHAKAQSDLRNLLNDAKQQFETNVNDRDKRLATTQQSLTEKTAEVSTVTEASAAERKHLNQEISKIRGQATALGSKFALRNLPDVADGKIISARSTVSTAFINLGRKDNLIAGTIFRVKNPRSDKVKAYATVKEVQQERSEVELSQIADRIGDPVRDGDELFNELYSPNETRNIFLLGSFSYPVNKPELEQLLKRYGNKVFTKMIPGVDLVILGNDLPNAELDGVTKIEETPEFKEANNLGVEFAPLRKIRDLIKVQ